MIWQGMEKRRGEHLVPLNFSGISFTTVSENDGWAARLFPIASLPFTFLVLVETGESFRFLAEVHIKLHLVVLTIWDKYVQTQCNLIQARQGSRREDGSLWTEKWLCPSRTVWLLYTGMSLHEGGPVLGLFGENNI